MATKLDDKHGEESNSQNIGVDKTESSSSSIEEICQIEPSGKNAEINSMVTKVNDTDGEVSEIIPIGNEDSSLIPKRTRCKSDIVDETINVKSHVYDLHDNNGAVFDARNDTVKHVSIRGHSVDNAKVNSAVTFVNDIAEKDGETHNNKLINDTSSSVPFIEKNDQIQSSKMTPALNNLSSWVNDYALGEDCGLIWAVESTDGSVTLSESNCPGEPMTKFNSMVTIVNSTGEYPEDIKTMENETKMGTLVTKIDDIVGEGCWNLIEDAESTSSSIIAIAMDCPIEPMTRTSTIKPHRNSGGSFEDRSATDSVQDASMSELNVNVFQKTEGHFWEYFKWTDTMENLHPFQMAGADHWTTYPFYDRSEKWFEECVLSVEPVDGIHSHFMYDFNFLEDRVIQDNKLITSSKSSFNEFEQLYPSGDLRPSNGGSCLDINPDCRRNLSMIVPISAEEKSSITPQNQTTELTDSKCNRKISENDISRFKVGKSSLNGKRITVLPSDTTVNESQNSPEIVCMPVDSGTY